VDDIGPSARGTGAAASRGGRDHFSHSVRAHFSRLLKAVSIPYLFRAERAVCPHNMAAAYRPGRPRSDPIHLAPAVRRRSGAFIEDWLGQRQLRDLRAERSEAGDAAGDDLPRAWAPHGTFVAHTGVVEEARLGSLTTHLDGHRWNRDAAVRAFPALRYWLEEASPRPM